MVDAPNCAGPLTRRMRPVERVHVLRMLHVRAEDEERHRQEDGDEGGVAVALQRGPSAHGAPVYPMVTSFKSSMWSSALPLPSTTALMGSSQTMTGSPVSSRRSTSRLARSAPPPVSTMPLSTISAASSGGVFSSARSTASTIAFVGSASASRISSELTTTVFGTPATRSRPFTSVVSCCVERVRVADLHLDALGRLLADGEVVLALQVRDDRLVHLVAADAHALRVDDAGERDDGDLGGAAADVDDHVAGGLGDGQPGADGRRHRLLDQVDLARAGALGALLDGALLDLGDAEGDADDDARLDQRAAVVRAGDEVAEHRLGDLEVGDDAVAQRADRLDVARRAAEHLLGLAPDGEDLVAAAGVALDGDDGGLARDNPLPFT